jgi:preprotein translocase SecE subunit
VVGSEGWSVLLPFTGGRTVTLLPSLQVTLPVLLAFAAFWLAYRVVNVPVFADFLIATEAELNKVSWTTQRRLIQDTIVVLVTVILLTVFLFVVDQIWAWVLSHIGVLQIAPSGGGQTGPKELPW